VDAWFASIQTAAGVPCDVSDDTRVYVASAHRAAACLYILQSIPAAGLAFNSHRHVGGSCGDRRRLTAEGLVVEIMTHLTHVPVEDSNIKATSWPTFVAGAESDDLDRRLWAINRLRALWRLCPWGFLSTAATTLEHVWRVRDGVDGQRGGMKPSWVQVVKNMDLNFVVV